VAVGNQIYFIYRNVLDDMDKIQIQQIKNIFIFYLINSVNTTVNHADVFRLALLKPPKAGP